jgi:hypothetical protein
MDKLRYRSIAAYITILVFLAAAFTVPAQVKAAGGSFGDGDGTAGNPYLIEDIDDLQAMNNDLTAHYALKNDIDLTTVPDTEELTHALTLPSPSLLKPGNQDLWSQEFPLLLNIRRHTSWQAV